jgi:hypothetical protein
VNGATWSRHRLRPSSQKRTLVASFAVAARRVNRDETVEPLAGVSADSRRRGFFVAVAGFEVAGFGAAACCVAGVAAGAGAGALLPEDEPPEDEPPEGGAPPPRETAALP